MTKKKTLWVLAAVVAVIAIGIVLAIVIRGNHKDIDIEKDNNVGIIEDHDFSEWTENEAVNQPTEQSAEQPTEQPTEQPVEQPTEQSEKDTEIDNDGWTNYY